MGRRGRLVWKNNYEKIGQVYIPTRERKNTIRRKRVVGGGGNCGRMGKGSQQPTPRILSEEGRDHGVKGASSKIGDGILPSKCPGITEK